MATRKNFLFLGGKDRITPLPSCTNSLQFDFDESELWNSNNNTSSSEGKISIPSSRFPRKTAKKGDQRREISGISLPVNVPDWSKILGDEYMNYGRDNNINVDEDGYEDNNNRIPPHEYLARTRVASFSVHEGIGRTLKGRDLSRVRNAIWKQTGFED